MKYKEYFLIVILTVTSVNLTPCDAQTRSIYDGRIEKGRMTPSWIEGREYILYEITLSRQDSFELNGLLISMSQFEGLLHSTLADLGSSNYAGFLNIRFQASDNTYEQFTELMDIIETERDEEKERLAIQTFGISYKKLPKESQRDIDGKVLILISEAIPDFPDE